MASRTILEEVQHGLLPYAIRTARELEDIATPVIPAVRGMESTVRCCAIEISSVVEEQASERSTSVVSACELVYDLLFPSSVSVRCQLVDRAPIHRGAAARCHAVEISRAVNDYSARTAPVPAAGERMEHLQLPASLCVRRQLVERALTIRRAKLCGAVKISCRVEDQVSDRFRAVLEASELMKDLLFPGSRIQTTTRARCGA